MTEKKSASALFYSTRDLTLPSRIWSVFRAHTQKIAIAVAAVLLLLQQSLLAQTQLTEFDLDIDPPVIDHEALEVGIAGEPQTFTALVIDDRGIEYVDFYYRASRLADYRKVTMVLDSQTRYIATVPTDLTQHSIEYYIEAADTGGNRVLKGFPFFPLIRNLDIPQPPAPLISSSTSSESSQSGSSRLLYIVLGALAVAVLASAGSSGDDVDGGGGGQVPLTINISSPTD